ncbi:HDOD domain-containing protein [Salinimonas sediminis]|uniref:HDOD domain-containing protein n=1 Tax=Salinimonas sediminis TaxID=2303538 RepID=A0A346NPK6_9ALTE|nr:HDOD domain-containing protein [Salinimonas sediminis]AXR07463.1 HDOD domain-containing protein [Salinimonas sediminis]
MSLDKYANFATQSFTLPDICLRIRDVLDDSHSDSDDIARLISVDPSLTAKILKLANSALFRFPAQVDSISKAVSVIGGEALYNLVVAETANTAFKAFDTPMVRLDDHWQSSVYTGMAAKYLAKTVGIRGSDRFFVTGILLNLSELVMAKAEPALYQQYVQQKKGLPWERQQALFGFNFAALSGTIMEQWQLPMPLYYPVQYLHNEQKQRTEQDIALLACARRVTIRELKPAEFSNIELFTPAIANSLSVEAEIIANVVTYANKETDKVSSLIY